MPQLQLQVCFSVLELVACTKEKGSPMTSLRLLFFLLMLIMDGIVETLCSNDDNDLLFVKLIGRQTCSNNRLMRSMDACGYFHI